MKKDSLKTNRRYIAGKEAGIEDKTSGMHSDITWFKKSGFWERDQAYCKGYQDGYLEGSIKKK